VCMCGCVRVWYVRCALRALHVHSQLTAMTLFAITQAPLLLGGRLPLSNDANGTWTLQLLTNAEV
jgi:hypothetical protein